VAPDTKKIPINGDYNDRSTKGKLRLGLQTLILKWNVVKFRNWEKTEQVNLLYSRYYPRYRSYNWKH
jgi:hypothetical protein